MIQLNISTLDIPEFIGQIIDVFEDFLEEKGIEIDNPDRDADDDNAAIIYGVDYGDLSDRILDTMLNWN